MRNSILATFVPLATAISTNFGRGLRNPTDHTVIRRSLPRLHSQAERLAHVYSTHPSIPTDSVKRGASQSDEGASNSKAAARKQNAAQTSGKPPKAMAKRKSVKGISNAATPSNTARNYKSGKNILLKELNGKALNTESLIGVLSKQVQLGRSYSQLTKLRTVARHLAKAQHIILDDARINLFCKGARAVIRKDGGKTREAKAFNLNKLIKHLEQDEDLDIATKAAIMTQCTFALRFDSLAHMRPKHFKLDTKKKLINIVVAKEKRRHDQLKRRIIAHFPTSYNEVVHYTITLIKQCQTDANDDHRKYMFTGKQKLDYGSYNALIKRIALDMGKNGTFSTHSCRRSGAKFWLKEGFSLASICYIGGWKSTETLLHYISSDFGLKERLRYEQLHGPLHILYP